MGEEPKSEENCWAVRILLFTHISANKYRCKIFQQHGDETLFQTTSWGRFVPVLFFFCKYQPTKYYNPTWLQSHDRMAVTGSRSEVKHAQMLAWICLSARGYQENFCVLSSKWTKRNQRKATHFFGTRGHGPSVAQLGLLWALRREGHPSGAWRADHTLLPCRPQDVWQGPSTDGRESVLWRSQTGLWICHG